MVQWLSIKYAQVVDAQGHLQLPLPKEAVLGFFGHLSGPAHECDINSIHADDAESPPLSVSCLTGYKSAPVDLYRTHEKMINGLMEVNDGKRHLKSNGYDLLAHKLFTQTPDTKGKSWATIVFAWSYFVLMWNLMSRSDLVDKMPLQHINWAEDTLIVEEQGHKGDQTGADKFGKHVYANPYEPSKLRVNKRVVVINYTINDEGFEDEFIVLDLGDRSVQDDNYRVLVPDCHALKLEIMFEYHDVPSSGHCGREKTYLALSREFYWSNQYKYVRKYVLACEVCQLVKPPPASQAPLMPLPVPAECWQSISMDFIFGLPKDDRRNDGILIFVYRFSKMVHYAPVPESIPTEGCARVFMESVFRRHSMPSEIVSDRDPRFTALFWEAVFHSLGTRLRISTSDHPQTDGQTERASRVLEDILRSFAHSFHWSSCLPTAAFAINSSVHASTSHTPFYVNGLRHPRVPSLLGVVPHLSGGGTSSSSRDTHEDNVGGQPVNAVDDAESLGVPSDEVDVDMNAVVGQPNKQSKAADDFVLLREAVNRFV
ncbi:hypothetical protein P43SY_009359 [Pythium insidiosum]|uniref:Integrase catalytic domain-containing protein n=1 Tax=Pythium insidiosum TaxID=114742 RepID=A0AAD5M3Q4_PYTIN|nr:hypothetical protein P43SY_009359 [Pythium insidiosum]